MQQNTLCPDFTRRGKPAMVPPSHNPLLALPPVYISDFTGFCHAAAFFGGEHPLHCSRILSALILREGGTRYGSPFTQPLPCAAAGLHFRFHRLLPCCCFFCEERPLHCSRILSALILREGGTRYGSPFTQPLPCAAAGLHFRFHRLLPCCCFFCGERPLHCSRISSPFFIFPPPPAPL